MSAIWGSRWLVRRAPAQHPRVLFLALSLGWLVGCGDGKSLEPPPLVPDRDLYWSLDLNHHAVLMSSATAPYDTLTLVATPRNRYGEALSALGAPQFTSPNPDQLLVSPTGVLTAVAPTSEPLPVIATLTSGNLKHEDTVYVVVVNDPAPPRLATFSAHPMPPDSAKVGVRSPAFPDGVTAKPSIRTTDSSGNSITNLPVRLRSSDNTVFTVTAPLSDKGRIAGVRPGTALLYANTTAFGIAKADTVPYRIGWPVTASVVISEAGSGSAAINFFPETAVVGRGALVTVVQNLREGHLGFDMVFDDADRPYVAAGSTPGAWDNYVAGLGLPGSVLQSTFCGVTLDCGAGDVSVSDGKAAARYFPTPGTYEYHSNLYGTNGRIIVIDDEAQ